jgi:opacity protein-like surface antigen
MNRSAFALLLASGATNLALAQTQTLSAPSAVSVPLVLVTPPAATLRIAPAAPPLAGVPAAAPRAYIGNDANDPGAAVMNNNASGFGVWKTDPKLFAGFNLNPHFAIETGFVNLYDRGTYFAEYTHMENVDGALGVKGYNSYLAARYNLAVNDRLDVYGRAGVAYSEFNHRDKAGRPATETDAGPYTGLGARYKVSEKASVSGAFERYGDSARWGPANSNNNGVSAKVNLGF